MATQRLPVCITPTKHGVTDQLTWDEEAMILDVKFRYEPSPIAPSLANLVNEKLNIRTTPHEITLDDLQLSLDDFDRISLLSLRTNPTSWTIDHDYVPPITGPAEAHFELPFDENGRFGAHVPLRVSVCAARQLLIASILVAFNGVRWHDLSERVLIGIDYDGDLAGFAFRWLPPNTWDTIRSAGTS